MVGHTEVGYGGTVPEHGHHVKPGQVVGHWSCDGVPEHGAKKCGGDGSMHPLNASGGVPLNIKSVI